MAGLNIENLITDHLDLWTAAVRPKSSAGRGINSKLELTGIKKLRELILELAVRGKLVPQDPSDEPASVLLERIAAEKARLVEEGKIKKPKALPEMGEEEKPFELPNGWVWCRLNDIMNISSGDGLTSKQMAVDGGIPVFGGNGITGYHDKYNVSQPTLVIGRVGFYCGSVHITPENAWVTDNAFITTFSHLNIDIKFLFLLLTATDLNENDNATAQPVISGRKLYPIVVCLPPLSEQRSIVTKVDELMALCDQLEQRSESQLAAHQTLVATLLATLTDSTDADELAQNWGRLSAHFDTLFTTEASIDVLKQTILQLAVMGKLVSQDPNDEPASALLARIAAEKAQLVKEKKIKKEKPLPAISEDEKPFELPQGWEWCRLNDLALSSEAGWSPQCEASPRENKNWGVLKVSAVTWGTFKPDENKALPNALEPKPEYEVQSGDFLISRANTAELVARAVVVPDEVPPCLMMSDKIIRFKFSKSILADYINLVNNCAFSRAYYAKVAGGTSSSMKNVSRVQIQNLVIALPPMIESREIIKKINKLMVLCDQLKSRLQTSQQTQLKLTETIIENSMR